MHDIKFIRSEPQKFDTLLQARGVHPMSKQILALDEDVRENQTKMQDLQTRRNAIAKEIGMLKSQGKDATSLMQESESIKKDMPALEERIAGKRDELHNILCTIPNLLQEDVPLGKDESSNVEVRKYGAVRNFDFDILDHHDLGVYLGVLDFEQTAKISGARFATFKGLLSRLERALVNFMLDVNTKQFGYKEMSAPVLVRDAAMFGTGQLPKFAQDSFETTDGYRLVPTSEVSLTNLVADSIVAEEELPIRFTTHSQCFRSEAGSAGRDTKGLIRMHQFSKVELVSITRPQESQAEHERMVGAAESILKQLGLPFRTMLLCSGDTGFAATKTYDLEVWVPSQNKYREISSCSNCKDFQARRMNARYKDYNTRENNLVHTLNGSALPIGRTIVAIMENYQNSDKSIAIPDILVDYMDGVRSISL